MSDAKPFARLEVKDVDRGLVTAVFATLNEVDHDGDVTRPGAFENGAATAISAFEHASAKFGAMPVGKGRIRTTRREAILEGQFFMDTEPGRSTFAVVKALAEDGLGEWSYRYDVLKHSFGPFGGRPRVRFLEKLRVIHVAPVEAGAGINTRTLVTKSAPADGLDPATRGELERIHLALIRDGLKAERHELLVSERRRHELSEIKNALHQLHVYAEIEPELVDPYKRDLAERLSRVCVVALGLQDAPPALHWLLEVPKSLTSVAEFAFHESIDGCCRPRCNDVWVRADLDPRRLLHVVAHEHGHIVNTDDQSSAEKEREAERFAHHMLEVLRK